VQKSSSSCVEAEQQPKRNSPEQLPSYLSSRQDRRSTVRPGDSEPVPVAPVHVPVSLKVFIEKILIFIGRKLLAVIFSAERD
jgi:hypothetical protein